MASVYVETSFFGAAVSNRTSPHALAWKKTSQEWWRTQSMRHQLYTSLEVVNELSDPEFEERDAAVRMLKGLGVLELTAEVYGFAAALVNERVMPGPSVGGDAVHVAVATVHQMDYVLSWNVKHLANPNKRTHFMAVCMQFGLKPPMIVTPDLLQDIDDDSRSAEQE